MRALRLLLLLALSGCITVLPTDVVIEDLIVEPDDELCELFITLVVVRNLNTYQTEELDIFDNRLGLDCRRVKIREEWLQMADGVVWLWTYETWDCYVCPDVVDVPNPSAGVYLVELPELRARWLGTEVPGEVSG